MKKLFFLFLFLFISSLDCFATDCSFIFNGKKNEYETDMNKALYHILYDKITYKHTTLKELLIDFNNRTKYISQLSLSNKQKNKEKYINELTTMFGIISLFSEAICKKLQPVTDKYNLGIIPGTECDSYICSKFIKGCNIDNYAEFEKLIKLKETVQQNIYHTRQDLLDIK